MEQVGSLFSFLSTQTVASGGIQTQVVGVEGKHADNFNHGPKVTHLLMMNETSYSDLAFHSEGKMLEVTWPTVCEKTFGGENVAIERKKERKK